jgi:hypothetical protein
MRGFTRIASVALLVMPTAHLVLMDVTLTRQE